MRFEYLVIITLITSFILFSGCISNQDNNTNNIIDDNNDIDEVIISKKNIKEINPCDLISKTFAESILKETVKEGQLKNNFAPQGKSCTYMTDKIIDNRKIEIKLYQNNIVAKEGIFDNAEKYFNNLKNAKIEASNLKITNLNYGNESYFDGFNIHIKKGDYYLIIEVSAEKLTASSSKEMKEKLANNRLELEKLVTEEVLINLK